MDFKGVKIEDLEFGFSSNPTGFGPSEALPDFGEQFDGRIFKPYNKRERLTKLVEFTMTSAPTQQPSAANTQKAGKEKQKEAPNQLVEQMED
jgi:hypothetical protein